MDLQNIDVDRLAKDAGSALIEAVDDLITGAKEDVQEFAGAISQDLLVASLNKDKTLVEQLLAQLEVVAEINRVRAEKQAWVVVRKITKSIFKAAAAGALSVLL